MNINAKLKFEIQGIVIPNRITSLFDNKNKNISIAILDKGKNYYNDYNREAILVEPLEAPNWISFDSIV